MGKLIYGAPMWSMEFEDRVLAHLRVVIVAKLRRGEALTFSWKTDSSTGVGRSSIWLHNSIPMQFVFFGGREPVLNRAWIDALMATANSPAGLQIVPEPPAENRSTKTE